MLSGSDWRRGLIESSRALMCESLSPPEDRRSGSSWLGERIGSLGASSCTVAVAVDEACKGDDFVAKFCMRPGIRAETRNEGNWAALELHADSGIDGARKERSGDGCDLSRASPKRRTFMMASGY